MEIEVGEYVRYKDGTISKVLDINKEEIFDLLCENFTLSSKFVVKHSKDIIDLIEVGDVIRYKIKNISTTLETKGFIEGIVDISDEEQLENIKKDKDYEIKSILTKEQMANIEYKVEEDK